MRLTIAQVLKLINSASPNHNINHLLLERRRGPDREPAAIKTSGTGLHSHQTFYCCTGSTARWRWVSGQKRSVLYSFHALSLISSTQQRSQRSRTVCVNNIVPIFLKTADGTKKAAVRNVDLN